MTNWYTVDDLYVVCNKKIANIPKKKATINWVGIDCVYKIKINNKLFNQLSQPKSKTRRGRVLVYFIHTFSKNFL